jgi:arylsulfatase A-like enzyme
METFAGWRADRRGGRLVDALEARRDRHTLIITSQRQRRFGRRAEALQRNDGLNGINTAAINMPHLSTGAMRALSRVRHRLGWAGTRRFNGQSPPTDGTTNGVVVHWPRAIKAAKSVAVHHVTDIAPTG